MNKQEELITLQYLRKHVDWLENNDFDNLYTNIQAYLFLNQLRSNCLTEIFLKSNIKIEPISKIYNWMFWNLDIKSYIIPKGVTEVCFAAFANCENLHDITIPNTVIHIDDTAFQNSGLRTITYKGTNEEWEALPKPKHWGKWPVYALIAGDY